MFTNINLWLGVLALAREIFKYLREKDSCPKDDKQKVIDAKQSLKTKDTRLIKKKVGQIFD